MQHVSRVDRTVSAGKGFTLDMFVERTGAGDERRLLAVVAWKGESAMGFAHAPMTVVGDTRGESALLRVGRWSLRVVLSPLLGVLWVGDRIRSRREQRRRRRTLGRAQPVIRHEPGDGTIRVGERAFATHPDLTLVVLVDEHDPATGRVQAVRERALRIEPAVFGNLRPEDRSELAAAVRSRDPDRIRKATEVLSRTIAGYHALRQALEQDPDYRDFQRSAEQEWD